MTKSVNAPKNKSSLESIKTVVVGEYVLTQMKK
jgi:hypothetical protein